MFTVGSYLAFYGVGLALSLGSPRLAVVTAGAGIGLVAIVAGIGVGWKTVHPPPTPRRPTDQGLLASYGLALLLLGLLALVAYLVRIGYVPLFQPGLEQNRVEAAEAGGALLRVLSLAAIPGTWILVAQAVAAHARRRLVLAIIAVAVVALGFALTGNRSPAFTTVAVALLSGLLAAGKHRLRVREAVALAAAGMLLVLSAGVFGAFRLASTEMRYGPPNPFAPPPNYPVLTAIAIRGYLVVPVQNLEYTMDAVPDRIGWRLGLTYVQPALTVLPGKQSTFDADLKEALGQRYAGGGTVPGLLGEAYANFGVIGWLLVPFIVGAVITSLYRLCGAWQPELAVLYSYAIWHVSIGGVVSGLSMASIFPFEAYTILAIAVLGLPVIGRRLGR